MDLFSWYYFWSWCNFLHNIFHQIWWFHKIFTQYGEYLLLFFGTSKITKNFEEKVTKYGEKYFRKKSFQKNCENILTIFITKFGDSLKFSQNFVKFPPNFLSHSNSQQLLKKKSLNMVKITSQKTFSKNLVEIFSQHLSQNLVIP